MKYIKGLDTLRAFAVLFVIRTHWGPVFDDSEPLGKFLTAIVFPGGEAGVYLFFVLSGFLITSLLLNARIASDGTDRPYIIKSFFVRRALRIFPIYYLFVFALYFIYPDVKEDIWYYLTYTSNILRYNTNSWASSATHTWTLAVEEQFYLIWPFLILFINKQYLKYVFITAIAIGIISSYFVLKVKIGPFLPFNCFDAFGIGGLYAYARQNTQNCQRFERAIRLFAPWLLIPYLFWKAAVYTHTDYGIFLLKTTESILCIWLIILVVNNKSDNVRKYLLENRILNFIGKISYGIYLYHPYFFYADPYLIKFINTRFANYPALRDQLTCLNSLYIYHLIMLVFTAWLSYLLVEKPILRLKKGYNYVRQQHLSPQQPQFNSP